MVELRDDGLETIQYDFKEYPIYIRRALLSTYPNYGASSHWHEDVELNLILDGQMVYQVNGEEMVLRKGEGIFVNSGQLHFGHSPQRRECDFICIVFNPMIFCITPETERRYILPVTKNVDVPYVHLKGKIRWQKSLLKLVDKTYRHKVAKQDYYLRVQADFFKMWDLLYENIANDSFADDAEEHDVIVVKTMVAFIKENYDNDISLEAIAMSGNVGQSKCCKLFKQYLGKSPVQYLNYYRLNQGAYLLRHTKLSVTEIALQVGYGGASYFTECFRRWSGQRPLEYRKMEI